MQEKSGRTAHEPCDAIEPDGSAGTPFPVRPRSPPRRWWRRASRSRRARACGRSNAAATPWTQRSPRPQSCASPSRCRPASAATSSRRSGTARSSTGSTPRGLLRCRRIRRARSRRPARGPSRFPAQSPAGPRSPSASGASGSTPQWATPSRPPRADSPSAVTGRRLDHVRLRALRSVHDRTSESACGFRSLGRPCVGSRSEGPDAIYGGDDRRSDRIVAPGSTSRTWRPTRTRWVEPLTLDYRGTTVCELPPPTQGVAALEGLGLLALGAMGRRSVGPLECVRLALDDAFAEYATTPTSPTYSSPASSHDGGRNASPTVSRAARWHGLPLRRRRRPHGRLPDPEPLRRLRVGRRRTRHRHRPPEPRRVLRHLGSCRARPAAVPHDHPRHAPARRTAARAVRRHGRLSPGAGACTGRVRGSSTKAWIRRSCPRSAPLPDRRRLSSCSRESLGTASRPRSRRSGCAPIGRAGLVPFRRRPGDPRVATTSFSAARTAARTATRPASSGRRASRPARPRRPDSRDSRAGCRTAGRALRSAPRPPEAPRAWSPFAPWP